MAGEQGFGEVCVRAGWAWRVCREGVEAVGEGVLGKVSLLLRSIPGVNGEVGMENVSEVCMEERRAV